MPKISARIHSEPHGPGDRTSVAAILTRLDATPCRGAALPARTWFEMATQNGAAAFGRHDTGALRPGNIANLLVLDGEAMADPYL